MHKCIRILLVAWIAASTLLPAQATELLRRASWQAKFVAGDGIGREVTSVITASPLDKAGVKVGDIILQVDERLVDSTQSWYDITDALVAGQSYKLSIRREHKRLEFNVDFEPVPLESYPEVAIEYGQVKSDYGILQRTLVTYPKSAQVKYPGIFIVQGLSCSSIENTPNRGSNFIRTLVALVEKSGAAVMRVEKPGLGDSQGNCSQTDFITELNGYERALQAFRQLPYVDANNIIVYGSSMGSAIAPYLANKYALQGVIADGTFFRSWFEHMLEIERRIKQMQGKTEAEISTLMNQAYIPLYYGMLVQKKSYQQVINEMPSLAAHNYHGAEHMYGRPMTYYHQLQEFDVASHWQNLQVPTRIRWGSHDWIMSEADNHMIVDVLRAAGNDNVSLHIYPQLDHWYTLHDSPANSFHGKPGRWENAISQQVVDWSRELLRNSQD